MEDTTAVIERQDISQPDSAWLEWFTKHLSGILAIYLFKATFKPNYFVIGIAVFNFTEKLQ